MSFLSPGQGRSLFSMVGGNFGGSKPAGAAEPNHRAKQRADCKMRRASYFARMLIVGGALIAGVTTQAYAWDAPKLELSGQAVFTTDYMFRSVSNTSQN